ncbi:MAG: threonine-phosphate decarboxylase, partial [Bacillota bacterium]
MREKPDGRLAEHGGNLRKASEDYGMPADGWLDFSANINPLGLAESVRKSILQRLEHIVNYPDPEAIECKQAIAAHYAL